MEIKVTQKKELKALASCCLWYSVDQMDYPSSMGLDLIVDDDQMTVFEAWIHKIIL